MYIVFLSSLTNIYIYIYYLVFSKKNNNNNNFFKKNLSENDFKI